MEEFITVAEYAEKYKMAKSSVQRAIKSGRIKSKKRGRIFVVADEVFSNRVFENSETNAENFKKNVQLTQALQIAKIQKMKSEIDLQKQKFQMQNAETLREHLTVFYEVFRDSFLNLKICLEKVGLDDEQREEINKQISISIEVMEQQILERLAYVEIKENN